MTSIGVGIQKDADGNNLQGENPYARVIGGIAGIMLPYMCISFLLQTKDDFVVYIIHIDINKIGAIMQNRPLHTLFVAAIAKHDSQL